MRSGSWWPVGIVGALAMTIVANAYLVYRAAGRGHAVVEPDYYHRAVRWDSTLAEERHNLALGWRLETDLGAPGARGAPLRVRLTDRGGVPLDGAAVQVAALHNLDAAHPVRETLQPAGGGAYFARLPLGHPGLWELRFEVARGAERFTATVRQDAGRGAGPSASLPRRDAGRGAEAP